MGNEITSNISENQLTITAPKMPEIKTGFRNVPIVISQEKVEDNKKKIVNEKEQNARLGRKLSQLGLKYSEIDQHDEKPTQHDEKPTQHNEKPTFKGNRSDRIFGIRHGLNMTPIELPGFDFNSFNNDDLSLEFENDIRKNFPSEFEPSKWAEFHEFKNGRFQDQPPPKSDKFRHVQRVPVENRATFNNIDLDENIIKASKWASASQPWFQTDLNQDADSKTVRISCL